MAETMTRRVSTARGIANVALLVAGVLLLSLGGLWVTAYVFAWELKRQGVGACPCGPSCGGNCCHCADRET